MQKKMKVLFTLAEDTEAAIQKLVNEGYEIMFFDAVITTGNYTRHSVVLQKLIDANGLDFYPVDTSLPVNQ